MVEFARMNSYQVLEETEKAVSNLDLKLDQVCIGVVVIDGSMDYGPTDHIKKDRSIDGSIDKIALQEAILQCVIGR